MTQRGILVDAARLLRLHLHQVGLTQQELATRIDRTPKHVSQVLRGKAAATDIDRWALAAGALLDVSLTPLETVPS